MKKNKSNVRDVENTKNLASFSLIVFLLDKLSDVIYNALRNGFFGKMFTSYTKEQTAFEEGFISRHFSESAKLKHYLLIVRKYFSKAFETSIILQKIESFSNNFVSMPLKSLGNFLFSFGLYTVIVYLLRLFIPVISVAEVDFVITGIIICIVSVPMLLSRDNIAMSVLKSRFLGSLFSDGFGIREESFRKRTEMSRVKNNLLIVFGMLLGILTLFVHPLEIIVILLTVIALSLIIFSPEIGIILTLFSLPFLSFFSSPAIMLGWLVLVITASFFVKLIRGKRILKFEIFDFSVLLFAAIIFFSGTITAGGTMGYHEALLTCELMLGYFLVVNLMRTEKWIIRCIGAIVSSGAIVGFVGVIQFALGIYTEGQWLDTGYFNEISGRVVSLFDNPNILAMYLVLVLPFALYMLTKSQSGKAKALGIISILSIFLCIILTWSRAAWIASIVCILVFLLFRSKKTLRYIFLSGIFAPFLPFLLPQSIVKRFMSIGDLADSSTMYRVYTWRGTLQTVKNNLLGGIGYGPTAFQQIYPQYAYAGIEAAEHSHNLYLQILVGTGIFGLIVFTVTMFLFTQKNLEFIKNSKSHCLKNIVATCICSTIGLLIFGMFDFVWYNYRVFFLFWIVIALACACVRVGQDEQRRHEYSSSSEIG